MGQGPPPADGLPELVRTPLAPRDDLRTVLRAVPTDPGVVQLLGEGERSLMIGRPAGMRRWAGDRLGLARRGRGRPAIDLRPVVRALRWARTRSGFEQRLLFERLMQRWVPSDERRDLPRPAWLHLDAEARFPRVGLAESHREAGELFGPFPDRGQAARARDRLHRLFPLRPCEEDFEPAPDLPLGLGCLYAQVQSCAAPCLRRIGEQAYRALAREAARFLEGPEARPAEAREWLPDWVSALGRRAVVAERAGEGWQVWPVEGGVVAEASAARAGDLETGLAALRWEGPAPDTPLRDAAWLAAWLAERRRKGHYLVLVPGEAPGRAARRLRGAPA